MNLRLLSLLILTTFGWAQQKDSLVEKGYLEDQIYIGLSYITLNNNPNNVSQNGFSNNFAIGFIKDIPFTNKGNTAFGVGLGYSRSTYYQNIRITQNAGLNSFEVIPEATIFKNNKFSSHVIDLPLELRWRTSTIDKYKFWRIYTGIKFSYVFASNAKFQGADEIIKLKQLEAMNKWQSGATFSIGYGTWTFNLYYGLSNIFKDAQLIDGTPLNIKDFRLGLIFYIL